MTLPPLLQFFGTQKGSSIVLLAFGATIDGDYLVIPSACVKEHIKKGKVLKQGKMRIKALESHGIDSDPFQRIRFLITKRG